MIDTILSNFVFFTAAAVVIMVGARAWREALRVPPLSHDELAELDEHFEFMYDDVLELHPDGTVCDEINCTY